MRSRATQGAPNAGRAFGFTGMRHAQQGGQRPVEGGLVTLGRVADLGAAQAERNDAIAVGANGPIGDEQAIVGRDDAGDVDDEAEAHA